MLSLNGSTKKHSNVSKELWQPQCQAGALLITVLVDDLSVACHVQEIEGSAAAARLPACAACGLRAPGAGRGRAYRA